jgi:hypothetical protein
MPKVRALAPLTDPEGNPIAVDAVVDVDDTTATAWRSQGKVSLLEDEERNIQAAAQSGHYGDVVGRDAVSTPHAESKEDEAPHKKARHS